MVLSDRENVVLAAGIGRLLTTNCSSLGYRLLKRRVSCFLHEGQGVHTFKLSIILILMAGVASAKDCTKLNTVNFLEETPWGQIMDCVEKDPGAFQKRDWQGYNLLMTAVGASIHPFELDALILAVPEGQLDDIMSAKDIHGRGLGHIAAADARDAGIFAILSRHGVSLIDEIDAEYGPDFAGRTPLHFAVQREGSERVVAALLTMGGVNQEDDAGITPFDIAIKKETIGSEALMLAKGNWPTVYRQKPVHAEPDQDADCNGFLTKPFFESATRPNVVACLTEKTQLAAVDRDGNSLIHLAAAYSNDPWLVDYILAFSDDPKTLIGKRNSAGMTPLHLAVEQGASADNLVHLLAWGAEPDALVQEEKRTFGKNRGLTALHIASTKNDEQRLARILSLLAFDADTMVQDVDFVVDGKNVAGGRTALHRALLEPDPIVLATLLEGQFWQESRVGNVWRRVLGQGVKQIKDDDEHTGLHIAASRKSDRHTLSSLVRYGFSVDAADINGLTPLMYAAQNFAESENFLYLLEQSEEPCSSSSSGATVEALLRTNEALMPINGEDASGTKLSPLAILKQRCP